MHKKKQRTMPGYLKRQEKLAAGLYKKVLPSVVTIFTEQTVFEKGKRKEAESLGSGVIISADGHVLTAAHVVSGAKAIIVKMQDETMRAAEMVFSEPGAGKSGLQSGYPRRINSFIITGP